MAVDIGTATAMAYFVHLLVDFLKHLVDHGSFVSDPALSDFMVFVTWQVILLMISSATVSIMWRVGSAWARAPEVQLPAGANRLEPPPSLSDTEAADVLYPGLTELLSCIDSSDTLTLRAAATMCKVMGANHVTDLVGRERIFAGALSGLVNENEVWGSIGTVAMPPTKRDKLIEALTAVGARQAGVWTKSGQEEAVESLKALALAERMFRQSDSTPCTPPEGNN